MGSREDEARHRGESEGHDSIHARLLRQQQRRRERADRRRSLLRRIIRFLKELALGE